MDYQAPQPLQSIDVIGSLLRGNNAAASMQENQLKLAQLRMAMGRQQTLQDYASGILTGGNGGGAQNAGAPTGGIQTGPQGAVTTGASHDQPAALPASTQGLSPTATQGVDPRHAFAIELLTSGDVGKGLTAQAAAQKDQIERQKLAAAPITDSLKMLAGSPNPGALLLNNPSLMQGWRNYAGEAGIDANDPSQMTPENIRTVAIIAHNHINSSFGGDQLPMPKQPLITRGKDGSVQETDPITGAVTQPVKPDLKQIVENGKPKWVTAEDAVGKEPFNPSIFGAGSLSGDAKELAYQQYVQTGQMPTLSRNPLMQSQMMDYIAKRSAQDFGPNSAQTVIANGQRTKAAGAVVKDFEAGKTGQVINGINTSVQHMELLDPLISNLNNTSSPLWNKVANTFEKQTGSAAPTNFAAIKEFVGGEVAKAVLPGGGGEAERHALLAPLDAANSPEQLRQAVQQIKGALAGKTEALRNQWEVGTQGNHGSFDRFLMPATKKALGGHDAPASNAPHPILSAADKILSGG